MISIVSVRPRQFATQKIKRVADSRTQFSRTSYDRAVDVAVVGGGIIGCSIAWELARRGARVVVIDAGKIGSGATQATAGVLAPFIEAPSPGPLQELTLRSFRMYDDFVRRVEDASELGVEFRRCGTFEVAASAQDVERLMRVASSAHSAGLDATWQEDAKGLLIPQQGYVRVEQLMTALRTAAERHGADFVDDAAVISIEAAASARPRIHFAAAVMEPEALVIAAGAWSDQLAPEAVGVHPVRGQLVRLQWRADPLPHVMWSEHCYVVPWLDGTVLVGATVEEVGFDQRVTADGVRSLLDAVTRFLPDAASATFIEARAGLRPSSVSGLPVIRPSATSPRIIYATGHYRNGILLAPLTADLVARLVADGDFTIPATR